MKKAFSVFLGIVLCMTVVFSTVGLTACDDGIIQIGFTYYAPINYKDEEGNFVGHDTELAKRVFEELGYEYEHFDGDICHQKNQICEYSFYEEKENQSLAIVRIEEILDNPRGIATISFLEVIKDDTGNGLFDYLLKSNQTMNASLKYLKPLRKI